jgi:ABC-type lipoprotein export system ATPase subunit
MLHSPKLLLADEPTGNLDAESAEIVVDAIKNFTERGGAALMVTHDSRAAAKARREILMKNGNIV